MAVTVRYYPGSEPGGARPSIGVIPIFGVSNGTGLDEALAIAEADWSTTDAYNTIAIQSHANLDELILATGSGSVTEQSLEHHVRNRLNRAEEPIGFAGYQAIKSYVRQLFETLSDYPVDLVVCDMASSLPLMGRTFGSGIEVVNVLGNIYTGGIPSDMPPLNLNSIQVTPLYSNFKSLQAVMQWDHFCYQQYCIAMHDVVAVAARENFGRTTKVVARDCMRYPHGSVIDFTKRTTSYLGVPKPSCAVSSTGGKDPTTKLANAPGCPELQMDGIQFADIKQVKNAADCCVTTDDTPDSGKTPPIPIVTAEEREGEGAPTFVTSALFADLNTHLETYQGVTDVIAI